LLVLVWRLLLVLPVLLRQQQVLLRVALVLLRQAGWWLLVWLPHWLLGLVVAAAAARAETAHVTAPSMLKLHRRHHLLQRQAGGGHCSVVDHPQGSGHRRPTHQKHLLQQ
jgi:hypothetical protein